MLKKALMIILLAIGLNMGSAMAGPAGAPNLPEMVRKANLIVIGRVQRTNIEDKRAARIFTYTISVDRVLKAPQSDRPHTISLKSTIRTTSTTKAERLLGIAPRTVADLYGPLDVYLYPKNSTCGLFLLKAEQPGLFGFVDPDHPVFEMAPSASSTAKDSADPLVAVVHQLTQFLATPGKTINKLHPGRPDYTNQNAIQEANDVLRTVPYKLVRSDLHAIANSQSASQLQRLLAIDYLVSMGDFDCLDNLKVLLTNPPDWSVEDYNAGAGGGAGGGGGGSAGGINFKYSPRGRYFNFLWEEAQTGFMPAMARLVPAMAELLRSRDTWARQDATYILSRIGTAAVIQPLSQLALYDSDSDVRCYAVSGLSQATGFGSGPNMWGSKEQEDRYINFWRRWASFKDQSTSPLSVPKLEDLRPAFNYTHELGEYDALSIGDLPELVKQSDLIVVGGLKQEHNAAGKTGTYRLSVERILKNNGQHKFNDIIVGLSGSTMDYGIFFLRRTKDGTYVPAGYGTWLTALPSAARNNRKAEPSPDPVNNVIDELIAVLSTPQDKLTPRPRIRTYSQYAVAAAAATPKGLSQEKLAPPIRQTPPQLDCSATDVIYAAAAGNLKELVSNLKQLPQRKLLSSLQSILKSPDLEDQSRLWVVNVLVGLGDYESLNSVKSLLLAPKSLSEGADCAVRALAGAIERGTDSTSTSVGGTGSSESAKVSVLGMLMHSTRLDVRRAASSALVTCKSKGVIEPFAKVGLYDPDMEVRYNSVKGLNAHGAGAGRYYEDEAEFEKNQATSVDFWRRWAGIGSPSIP